MPLIKNFATQPIFALLVAGCLLSYAPVLLTTYATADDYAVLASSLHGKIAGELTLRVAGGRPIDAMLVGLSFSALPGLGSLRLLRLISVLGIALLAWSLARTLNQQGWSPAVAGCLSFIVCTAPPFQQHAAWTVSAFYPFAAIAAGGAWCMADSAYEQRCWGERWRLAFGAVALELVALSMYQPTAMFFWVFATLGLFSPDARLSSVLHRFGWYSTIMGTALLLGFAVYKLGVLMYGNALPPTRLGVVQDIGEKAVWFFRQPLYNGLNLGHFFPTRHYAVGIAVFLLCGLAVYFQGTLKTRLSKVGIALLVLPLSYMPNLIAAENWAAYRSRVPIPEDTGDFRLLSRRAVDALNQLREQHRFRKGLYAWIGYEQRAVPYRRNPRYAGKTKWNYWALWNLAIEGITSFTEAPLKIAMYLGLLTALGAFMYGVFVIVKTLLFGDPVAGYPSLMVTILFLGGVQLVAIGIIGEYLGRMFTETKHRPLYLVQGYQAVRLPQPLPRNMADAPG